MLRTNGTVFSCIERLNLYVAYLNILSFFQYPSFYPPAALYVTVLQVRLALNANTILDSSGAIPEFALRRQRVARVFGALTYFFASFLLSNFALVAGIRSFVLSRTAPLIRESFLGVVLSLGLLFAPRLDALGAAHCLLSYEGIHAGVIDIGKLS